MHWVASPSSNKGTISLGIFRSSSLSGSLWVGRKTLKAGQNTDCWTPHIFLDLRQEPQGRWVDSSLQSSLLGQPQSLCLSSSHDTPRINSSHPSLVHCLPMVGASAWLCQYVPSTALGKEVRGLSLLLKESTWQAEAWLVCTPTLHSTGLGPTQAHPTLALRTPSWGRSRHLHTYP